MELRIKFPSNDNQAKAYRHLEAVLQESDPEKRADNLMKTLKTLKRAPSIVVEST
jgi:hypothetical protein